MTRTKISEKYEGWLLPFVILGLLFFPVIGWLVLLFPDQEGSGEIVVALSGYFLLIVFIITLP